MTEPPRATRPIRAPEATAETVSIEIPDEARLWTEIDEDRHHERFLVRAALVAAILVALVITARLVWA